MMRHLIALLLALALLLGQPGGPPAAQQTPGASGGSTPAAAAGVPEPTRERAYRANNLGVALLEQFNYVEAEQAFRQALQVQPELALPQLNLAIALLYAGRGDEAAVAAREAVRRMPDAPQAHFVLGLTVKAEGGDEAIAAFNRVLAIDPADAGAKIHLGQIHLQQRRYPEGLRLFEEAAASEPYNVTAAYNVALAMTRSGRGEDGRAAMQRFEALRDGPYGVTYAQTYLSQGRYAEAMASTGAEIDLVDTATPAVTFAERSQASFRGAALGTPTPGGVLLFDSDGDGDLDLVAADRRGLRFLRNMRGAFEDATAAASLDLPRDAGWTGIVAGDYDNDGRQDLFALGEGTHRLLHQAADGRFEDVTQAAALGAPGGRTAAFSDLDHDGDLDLVTGDAALRVRQNNGNGTFADITAKTGIAGATAPRALVATDFDNRRDVDLLVLTGSGPQLFQNLRDGSFRDTAGDVGLTGGSLAESTAVAAADINKDGFTDFFFGRLDAAGSIALSNGQRRFTLAAAPEATTGAAAAQFIDYDNDGLLDLLIAGRGQLRLFRNVGQGRLTEVSAAAALSDLDLGAGPLALATGDVDLDGDIDLVVRAGDGTLRLLHNSGDKRHRSLAVSLQARVSNRSGVGARVEMRAGSLRQVLETSMSTPASAPADVRFGLGTRDAADAVRVLWPSGVLQAEAPVQMPPAGSALAIEELDRKPSSCPYLFTWNGSSFEFVTDFMGGGEMGGWLAPSVWNVPDPDEYVRIGADQLQPRNGRYELRMTNELEEALFFDRVQLVAVDHPADVELFPNEGLRSPPRPPLALTAVRRARPPAGAVDEHGHDVLPQLSAIDRRYVDDFALSPRRGYAEPHELILDLGPDLGASFASPVLLLTGWTDYAFSNDNVAAAQAAQTAQPPRLQVKAENGRWRTVVDEVGIPVGRPQTIVVDLAGRLPRGSRQLRLLTNMRIYWDRILVAEAADSQVSMTRIDPATADLRARGMSRGITPDGREPFGYDYQRLSSVVPWKVMTGSYTREGDVRPLLTRADDLFVIAKPGDEVALTFVERPPVASGRARTFLFYAHGYSKEMNPRSALPETVEPLPFQAMSGYPYPAGEHYPRSRAHRDYRETYNTRRVFRSWPSIDVVAETRGDGTAPRAGRPSEASMPRGKQ